MQEQVTINKIMKLQVISLLPLAMAVAVNGEFFRRVKEEEMPLTKPLASAKLKDEGKWR